MIIRQTKIAVTQLEGSPFTSVNEEANPTNKELAVLTLQTIAQAMDYQPSMAVLNEMVSTGSLQDVSNDKLKKHLTEWFSNLEQIKSQEKILYHDRQRVFNHFLQEAISMRLILNETGFSEDILELPNSQIAFNNAPHSKVPSLRERLISLYRYQYFYRDGLRFFKDRNKNDYPFTSN